MEVGGYSLGLGFFKIAIFFFKINRELPVFFLDGRFACPAEAVEFPNLANFHEISRRPRIPCTYTHVSRIR